MASAPPPYLLSNLKRILLQGVFGGPAAYDEPDVATFARGFVDLNNNLLFSPSQLAALFALVPSLGSGIRSFPIPSGVDFVTVTGLGLSFTPTKCQATVMKVTGGLNLGATPRLDTLVPGGFVCDLTGLTDSSSYVLVFQLAP